MKLYKKICSCLMIILMLTVMSAASAWANIAANTQIINQAQLSYFDGASTKTATASVTVTVSLVAAVPTIVPGPNQTTSYGPGATLTDSFTVTAGANGPDTYNITATVSGQTNNNSNGTATPTVASVILGASVTTTGSTDQMIVVPSDGTSNASVNGIEVGDTVVINGEVKTVTGIVDNASGTSTITLNSQLTGVPGVGVLVAEQKVINTTVTPGTIVATGTDVTVSDTITMTSATTPAVTVTSGAVLNTFTSGVATLTKYVRNVTTPMAGTGAPYGYGGNDYYLGGVTAKPGEVLEYALVATNTSLTGSVSAAVITDALPTSYVTFRAGVYSGSTDVTYFVVGSPSASYLTAAADADAANYAAPTLTVNVGTGATNAAGGTIPASTSLLVLYQVTINP